MTGADDVFGHGIPCHGGLHGACAVSGRDTGGDTLSRLDGDGEFGAKAGAVARRHQRQLKGFAALACHRHADQAAGETSHEIDVLGSHAFGGDDDVALVFPVLVIHEDDHLAGSNIFDQFFSGVQSHGGHSFYSFTEPGSGSRVRRGSFRSGPRHWVRRPCHPSAGAPGNAPADPLPDSLSARGGSRP